MASDENDSTGSVIALTPEVKDVMHAKMHIQAQHNTIVQLSKEIQKLKEKNRQLELLISQQTPVVGNTDTPEYKMNLDMDDEETICRLQLKKLRDKAMISELTLEEAKRVEIYTKIIMSKENQPKKLVVESKSITPEQLMAAYEAMEKSDE